MTATKTRPSSTTKKKVSKKVSKKGTKTKKPSWGVVTFEKIEEWRTKLGLSKSGMAEALGVTNSTFHNWRRGTTVPHPNQQDDIAMRLSALERSVGTEPTSLKTSGMRGVKAAKVKAAKVVKAVKRSTLKADRKTVAHQGIASPGTPMSYDKVPRDDIATVTAAWLANQKKAVSAGSVVAFVEALQVVM